MRNLQTVYSVSVRNRLHHYASENIRDRVYDQLTQAEIPVTKLEYPPGTLDHSHSGEVPGVSFGNPALARGQKPGRYGG